MDLFQRLTALHSNDPFKAERVTADTALRGGKTPVLPHPKQHTVLGTPLTGADDPAFPDNAREVIIALGCYWGVERLYWQEPGVLGTSVGFAGGFTPNPTYREVCTGRTGHTEAVRVVYDPDKVSIERLLQIAFENHDPTQGDRQGNDVGSQYRSAIYCEDSAQLEAVKAAVQAWQPRFTEAGYGEITTEVALLSDTPAGEYYLAEDEHQQYLDKNPAGYCNHGPNGVSCPVGVL